MSAAPDEAVAGEPGLVVMDVEQLAPYPATAYLLEAGERDLIIDFLYGMLAQHGMTGDEIDTALEGECARWLREERVEWWER